MKKSKLSPENKSGNFRLVDPEHLEMPTNNQLDLKDAAINIKEAQDEESKIDNAERKSDKMISTEGLNGKRMMSQCVPPKVNVKRRQEKKIDRDERLLNLKFLKGSPIECF